MTVSFVSSVAALVVFAVLTVLSLGNALLAFRVRRHVVDRDAATGASAGLFILAYLFLVVGVLLW